MTCAEKYFLDHPGEAIKGCPQDYGYLAKPKDCYQISCFKDCWARSILKSGEPIKKKGRSKTYG